MNIEGWHEVAYELKGHYSRDTAHAALKAMGFRCQGSGAKSWFFTKPGCNFGVKISHDLWLGGTKASVSELIRAQQESNLPFAKIHWVMSRDNSSEEFSACICEAAPHSYTKTEKAVEEICDLIWGRRDNEWVFQDAIEWAFGQLGYEVWDLHAGNIAFISEMDFVVIDFDSFSKCRNNAQTFSWHKFWQNVEKYSLTNAAV